MQRRGSERLRELRGSPFFVHELVRDAVAPSTRPAGRASSTSSCGRALSGCPNRPVACWKSSPFPAARSGTLMQPPRPDSTRVSSRCFCAAQAVWSACRAARGRPDRGLS